MSLKIHDDIMLATLEYSVERGVDWNTALEEQLVDLFHFFLCIISFCCFTISLTHCNTPCNTARKLIILT